MTEITKEDARIASDALYHHARYRHRMAQTDKKQMDSHLKKADSCARVARVLRERSQ